MKTALFAMVAIGSAIALPSTAYATITTLDFAGNICGINGTSACGNGTRIGQNYGDTAGVDVQHAAYTIADVLSEPYVKYWNASYGDLVNVAWGGENASNYYAEFTFTALAGHELRLLDFDAGCYVNRTSCRTINYSVRSGATTVASGTGVLTQYPGHANIILNTGWTSTGYTLRWGPDSYDVGLDNIRFEWRPITGAVPEPAIWAMMIIGFGLVGNAARRRPRRVAPL